MYAIKSLQNKLNNQEAAIIFSEVNRLYLTGFESSDGLLIILKNDVFLVLDSRYIGMARNARKAGKIDSAIILKEERFFTALKEIVVQNDINTVFFEDRRLIFSQYIELKNNFENIIFSPLGDFIEKLRMQKSVSEIEKIKVAQKITETAFEHILNYIDKNKTEKEIVAKLEYYLKRCGADGLAFETICVSGDNSALPHGKACDRQLVNNSFLTLDFGAKFEGYCSDMTRTVFIGTPDEKQKYMYETVLKAQNAAFNKIKAGVKGKEVDFAARDYINNTEFFGLFGHSLGHSLGLEIHESPNFSPSNDTPVLKNSVLSVEPGIYKFGLYGVRIEDIVLVTDGGYINLTNAPKKLILL